jgi:hypothetical protein
MKEGGACDDREMGENPKAFLPGRAPNARVRGAARVGGQR